MRLELFCETVISDCKKTSKKTQFFVGFFFGGGALTVRQLRYIIIFFLNKGIFIELDELSYWTKPVVHEQFPDYISLHKRSGVSSVKTARLWHLETNQ